MLCFTACEEKENEDNSCSPPPSYYLHDDIDREIYNDVRAVWAYNNFTCDDPRINQHNGKNIKVYGWLIIESGIIKITCDSLYALGENPNGWKTLPRAMAIQLYSTPEIQTNISAYDLTRKCFLKGELNLEKILDGPGAWCCQVGPTSIRLKSIDDIYFEE